MAAGVCIHHSTRFALRGPVGMSHSTRFALVDPTAPVDVHMSHSTRFDLTPAWVGFKHSTRFAVQPDLFYRIFVAGEVEAKEWRDDYGFEVWLEGPEGALEITDYVAGAGSYIRQPLDGPAEFSIALNPASREIRPKLRSGDLFYNRFDGDAFDENFNLRRFLQIGMWSGGKRWWSPRLLQFDFDWSHDERGNRTAAIVGTDLTELLLQNDQNLDNFFSSQSGIYTAHQVVSAILGRYKIKHRLEFDDFQISQFTAKGATAWDYIRSFLWVMQAESYFDGEIFVARNPVWKKTGRGAWSLRDVHDLKSYSYKKSTRDLKNEFTMKRPEKVPTPLADVEIRQVGNTALIPLNPPSRTIIPELVVRPFHGDLNLWTYFDAQGNPIPGAVFNQASQVVLPKPAAFVRVNYQPAFDIFNPWPPDVPPYARVVFWGGGNFRVGEGSFIVVGRDAASQQKFGPRRDRSPVDSTLVVDRATARTCVDRMAAISVRRSQPSSWTALVNPEMNPGDIADLVCSEAGFFDPTPFKVESLTKNFGGDGNFLMGVECSGNQA